MTFSQIRERHFQAGLNFPPCVDSVESRLSGLTFYLNTQTSPRETDKFQTRVARSVPATESNGVIRVTYIK